MHTIESIYLGDLQTKATHVKSGVQLITDAPIDNQGKGESFSPTDLTTASLGSCIMTIIGIWAKKEQVDLKGTQLKLTKIMSTNLPRRIGKIEVEISLLSNRLISDTEKTKIAEIASTCPVALSLHPDIAQKVSFEWKVLEQ